MITDEPPTSATKDVYSRATRSDKLGIGLLRLGLVIVLLWIGAVKFTSYEAGGIVPIVSNSPLIKFVYRYSAPEYRKHMNRQGGVVPSNCTWHTANGTYAYAHGLGLLIVARGLLIALHPVFPRVATRGGSGTNG